MLLFLPSSLSVKPINIFFFFRSTKIELNVKETSRLEVSKLLAVSSSPPVFIAHSLKLRMVHTDGHLQSMDGREHTNF